MSTGEGGGGQRESDEMLWVNFKILRSHKK